MGAKDAVRALLDQLPDDCTIDDMIEQLCRLGSARLDESELPHGSARENRATPAP